MINEYSFFSTATQNNTFENEKSDVKTSSQFNNYSQFSRDQEIGSITKEIEELHHLDKSSWTVRKQDNVRGAPVSVYIYLYVLKCETII